MKFNVGDLMHCPRFKKRSIGIIIEYNNDPNNWFITIHWFPTGSKFSYFLNEIEINIDNYWKHFPCKK